VHSRAVLLIALVALPLAGCAGGGCTTEATLTWDYAALAEAARRSHVIEPVGVDSWIHESGDQGEWRLVNVAETADGWTVSLMARAYGVFLLAKETGPHERGEPVTDRVEGFLVEVGFSEAAARAWVGSHDVSADRAIAFNGTVALQNEPSGVEAANGFWRFGAQGTLRVDRARPHFEGYADDDHVAVAAVGGRGAWWGPLPAGKGESAARARAAETLKALMVPGEPPASAAFERGGGACP